MADRKATNKYYPPEWEPKHGSINKFRGSHPLRERASKISQGILVVRFEMPWGTFCEKCSAHLQKGKRFNAEKSKAGNYFSTTIWNFKMKCPHCDNEIQVATDPQNRDYRCVSGLKRREETKDLMDEAELGLERLMDDDEREAIRADPFRYLENQSKDAEVAEVKIPELSELISLNEDVVQDDYLTSQVLRAKFRTEKKVLEGLKNEAVELNLNIPLLPTNEADKIEASKVRLQTTKRVTTHTDYHRAERRKMKSESIFGTSSARKQALDKCRQKGIDPRIFGLPAPASQRSSRTPVRRIGVVKESSLAIDLKKRHSF